MSQIMINTDVNAPGCPCEILGGKDFKRSILVQVDHDYPGMACNFGWTLRSVQRCAKCHKIVHLDADDMGEGEGATFTCVDCEALEQAICDHDNTDGSVDCKHCSVSAGEFIADAREFLENNDGAIADDPGYFDDDGE